MMKRILTSVLLCVLLQSCYTESYIPVEARFTTAYKSNDESVPVYLIIDNLSTGADTYVWEFAGGTPAGSSAREPGEILYSAPGSYSIRLTVSNADGQQHSYEQTVEIRDAIHIRFSSEIIDSDYPPVQVRFSNATQGQGLTYRWDFEGGVPASSDSKDPPDVLFAQPGSHVVRLSVSNGYETFQQTDTIYVRDHIIADFGWTAAHADYDYQAPVQLSMTNTSEHAISYAWEFAGGTPATSSDQHPQVIYSQPGTYSIRLTASNGKQVRVTEREVVIYPDTGIYILQDIRLGVNYAHNTSSIGAYYSTRLRQSFHAGQVTAAIAPDIDIVYQGQSNSFSYNKFISPAAVSQYGFAPLPGAVQTLFINSQDICNCGLSVSEAEFDAMSDGGILSGLQIPDSAAGQQHFGSQLPHVVLFRTQDGRKGAIRIRQYVAGAPDQSYIICDIKVQK